MRKILLSLSMVLIQIGSSQAKHPLDFDDEYFKASPYISWMKDPFKSAPGFAKTEKETSSWPKLSQVNLKSKVPYAMLDGKRYSEGQFISENRFVSVIGANYVIITEGNFDYEIVMPSKERKVATEEVPSP